MGSQGSTAFPRAVLALALAGLAFAGCGGAQGEDSQSYAEVLQGLRRAALSNKPYEGAERARSLDVAERNVVLSFCEFARQIGLNREAWKLPQHAYVVSRIRSNAYSLGGARFDPLNAAMGRLHAVVDLAALNADLLKRYTRACYR